MMKPQRSVLVELDFVTWFVLICSGRLRKARPQSGGVMSASPNDSTEETTAVFPPTYIVIQFSRHMRTTALVWLVDKICGKRLDGGAELLVRKQPHRDGEASTSFNWQVAIVDQNFFFIFALSKSDIKRPNVKKHKACHFDVILFYVTVTIVV